MKISLDWLKEFVEIAAGTRELKSALTGVGLAVEQVTAAGDDLVFEIEVTTNRPDWLSHYGVAREVASIYSRPLKPPSFRLDESGAFASSEVSIEISDTDLCARYCARVIEKVEVKPSPEWLARRLQAVGVRAINNIADITNYVLMELGQPLHAFDLARLGAHKIIVRRARPGERIRTLDGIDRTLSPDNLVIADATAAVALAGVMGGASSEISTETRSVLLESAWFDPLSIRRTSKAQGLHTEASHRFERGADIEMAPFAADRAASMIAELAGGEVRPTLIDVYPRSYAAPELLLRAKELLRILGTEIAAGEVERILRSLGFEIESRDRASWHVKPPSWRVDIRREVDLIEEVARIHGYDRLPSRIRPAPPRVDHDDRRPKELAISSTLVGLGYREIIANSMVDPAENRCFTDARPVQLLNPLSQESSAMRLTAIPGMLRALKWNLDRGHTDLRLFETGRTYAPAANGGSAGLPIERRVLSLGLTGNRRSANVHDSAKPLDFFDLKGDLEELLQEFDLRQFRFEPRNGEYFEPGMAGRFLMDGKSGVFLGELRDEIAGHYKLRQPVWLAEVDIDALCEYPLRSPRFVPYSKYPAVTRDFSLIVPEELTYAALQDAILQQGQSVIENMEPVDIFRGGSIPAGHYSLLLRITLHSLTHTLSGSEVDEASRQIIESLAARGVQLRS
jgi:phenylalanyl-tRNA synthetase beta chain